MLAVAIVVPPVRIGVWRPQPYPRITMATPRSGGPLSYTTWGDAIGEVIHEDQKAGSVRKTSGASRVHSGSTRDQLHRIHAGLLGGRTRLGGRRRAAVRTRYS